MSKDEYYANADARLNTLLNDERQALMLKRSYVEYESSGDADSTTFTDWLEDKYGVSLHQNEMGYELPFVCADQQKFMLFTLKFS